MLMTNFFMIVDLNNSGITQIHKVNKSGGKWINQKCKDSSIHLDFR